MSECMSDLPRYHRCAASSQGKTQDSSREHMRTTGSATAAMWPILPMDQWAIEAKCHAPYFRQEEHDLEEGYE